MRAAASKSAMVPTHSARISSGTWSIRDATYSAARYAVTDVLLVAAFTREANAKIPSGTVTKCPYTLDFCE
eukprot:scaffold923_cov256-Pinguiococcus_pyrenoidosus.AAC.55